MGLSELEKSVEASQTHPLENRWTLWSDDPKKRSSQENWSENLKMIMTVGTVEDFWSMYKSVPASLELNVGANYYFFREGIRPEWEDKANRSGGRWAVSFQRPTRDIDNNLWLNTLLGCIGNECDAAEDINGAIFSVRKSLYRVSIWTGNCEDPKSCETIGKFMRRYQEIGAGIKYAYQSHRDSMSDGYGAKDRYTLGE